MTGSNPMKPHAIRRLIWFWQDSGEWILGVIVVGLFLALGYSWAMSGVHDMVLQMQTQNIQQIQQVTSSHELEKKYLREEIQKKNDDIRFLQGKLAEQGQGSAAAVQDAAKAVKNLTESVAPLPPDSAQ